MSEDIGYIKGKVEGIETNVEHMRDNQTKLFEKFDDVEELIKELPCNGHANDIDNLKKETSSNRARSHGAAEMVKDIRIKTRPIVDEYNANIEAEEKEEERKWYQRVEIRIGLTVGMIVGIFNFLPDIIKFIKALLKG